MNKKLISIILSFGLLFSSTQTTSIVFAKDNNLKRSKIEIADNIKYVRTESNNIYTITNDESFNKAKEDIIRRKTDEGLKEATLEFANDYRFKKTEYSLVENYFAGIEGVTITLKSKGDNPVKIYDLGNRFKNYTVSNNGFGINSSKVAYFLIGNLILDNIILDQENKDITYFAQGNSLIMTENFDCTKRISLVGGCLGREKCNEKDYTDLKDSDMPKSTHIEVYGGKYNDIIGGGFNSDIGSTEYREITGDGKANLLGSTYVKIELPNKTTKDNIHNLYNVFGGSYFTKENDNMKSIVYGDTHVEVVSGDIGNIYGGGSGAKKGNTSNAAVYGNTNVIMGTDEHKYFARGTVYGGGCWAPIRKTKIYPGPGGWGFYETVKCNTNVVINNTAKAWTKPEISSEIQYNTVSDVFGGSEMSTVEGKTHITLNGGNDFDGVYSAGRTEDQIKDKVENLVDSTTPACTIDINGGNWSEINSGAKTHVSNSRYAQEEIYGGTEINFNGGKVDRISLSTAFTNIGKDHANENVVFKDSILNIYGGEFNSITPGIAGYNRGGFSTNSTEPGNSSQPNTEKDGKVDGKRIVNIKNANDMEMWQMSWIDEINVDNSATFTSRGSILQGALKDCGDLNINKGTLILSGTNNLKGSLNIKNEGKLGLNGKALTTNGVVNANGGMNGEGNGKIMVLSPKMSDNGWISLGEEAKPVKGEVYIKSNQKNETATNNTKSKVLTLATKYPQLYLEYTEDKDAIDTYKYAWRINEDNTIETVNVTFNPEGGIWKDLTTENKVVEVIKGNKVDSIPENPTKEGATFDGWYTEENKSFDFNSVIDKNIELHAKWIGSSVNKYKVTYKFESGTSGKNLPNEVLSNKLPSESEIEEGGSISAPTNTYSEVKVNGGKWIFKEWTPKKQENITSDVEFIGKWEFVKDSTGGGGTGGGTVTPPTKPEEPDRIEGGDRIETSVESSKDLYPNGTNAVVLANCERYTDVLTADPFAIQEKASALLTYKYELPEKTLKEIERLGAKKIYISGGYEAVSKKVVDELAAKGYEIFRFDGVDRYDTARKIAIKIREKGNTNAAELASGEDFPDALCMTPLAVKDHAPILLTKKDSIPKYTKQALAEWDIENIKIGGLEKAVSPEVEKQLKAGFEIEKNNKKDSNVYDGAKAVKRIGGEDRYETSAKLAKESYPESKLGVYATGEDFPDALIAGNYAGTKEAPVLLVKGDSLPEPIEKYTKESKIKKATIIGGVNAVSDKVFNLIKAAINK